MREIVHMLRKEFRQLRRDKFLLPMTLFIPVIQLVLLGYAATTDIKHLGIAVCDYDHSSASRQFIRSFTSSRYLDVRHYVSNIKEVQKLLDKGKCSVGLVIPPDFDNNLRGNKRAAIQLLIDGSDPNAATVSLGYARQIVAANSKEIIERRLQRAGATPFTEKRETGALRVRIWYNPELRSTYFMVPAVICVVLTVTTMIMTSAAIVRERERGTIEQLIVTPIKPYQLILGKTMPFVFIGLCDIILIILVGTLWFKVPVAGSLLLLFAISGLFVLTTLGLGIFVSTISQTQQQAMLTAFFFFMPSLILSGFIFPIANMPKIIQYITYFIPLRYFLVIVRGIFLKGAGLSVLYNEVIALAIFGIVIFALSAYRFRKRLE